MKPLNRRGRVGIGIVLLVVMSFVVGVGFERVRAGDTLEKKLEVFWQALDAVRSDYVEKNLEPSRLVYGAIRGVLESLEDPYSRFLEPKDYKEMKMRMNGAYNGIGIYIGLKNKQLVVISPIEGTPADKAGLRSGDRIATIDGRATKDMALEMAVGLIRGLKGTTVTLGILRGDAKEPFEVKIVRAQIVVQSVKTRILDGKIGYLKLMTFENRNAADEVKAALNDFIAQGCRGMVLDMRGNGGGLLKNAQDIASLFIEKGAVVHTVDRDGRRESLMVSGDIIWTKPIVVLVNEFSASASEILAGAIQDSGVGPVVGTHTFGKASVQHVREFSDGSAMLITIAKYLTPSGHDITKKGIQPDVLIELPKKPGVDEEMVDPMKIDVEHDIQLQKSIEVLKAKMSGGAR